MNTNFSTMKKIFFIFPIAAVLMLFSAFTIPQNNIQKIPAINILDLGRRAVNSKSFTNNGKPTIIYFWATYDAPSKKGLDDIAEVYDNWQRESGVKLIAVSIDDARTFPRVRANVDAKEWKYEIYVDEDSTLKRSMHVEDLPHLFVLNANNEIVWQTSGYKLNDSVAKLHDVINKVAKGEKPE